MKKLYVALACSLMLLPAALFAQGYGTGIEIYVPYVAPGTLTLDGNANEGAWSNATSVDMIARWDGAWSGHPDPDVTTMAKLLWTTDTLYAYVEIQDYQLLYWGTPGNPWQGEQILIGVDGTHAQDTAIDNDFAGWPENAPDLGATAYKVWRDGITSNWGYSGISPMDSGWVRGTVVVDTVNFRWGVEMAMYLSQVGDNARIGFNIGGATADTAWAAANGGDGAYAYFSWQAVQYPGGDVMHDAGSFSTLTMITGTVGVDERRGREIPGGFRLSQNYPNPFNPETKILYELPRAANVTLAIYNLLGQQVATLVSGERAPGKYEVRWNPGNLGSGVYLYQLKVDDAIVAARKMMLLK